MDLAHEAAKLCTDRLLARIKERLEELGPSYAIGYRLKPSPLYRSEPSLEPAKIEMAWETHEVHLIDDQVPVAHVGFHYVRLPTPAPRD